MEGEGEKEEGVRNDEVQGHGGCVTSGEGTSTAVDTAAAAEAETAAVAVEKAAHCGSEADGTRSFDRVIASNSSSVVDQSIRKEGGLTGTCMDSVEGRDEVVGDVEVTVRPEERSANKGSDEIVHTESQSGTACVQDKPTETSCKVDLKKQEDMAAALMLMKAVTEELKREEGLTACERDKLQDGDDSKERIVTNNVGPTKVGAHGKVTRKASTHALLKLAEAIGDATQHVEVKKNVELRPITMDDMKKAKDQVAASLSADSVMMNELRQWNALYGEGGNRKKQTLTYFL